MTSFILTSYMSYIVIYNKLYDKLYVSYIQVISPCTQGIYYPHWLAVDDCDGGGDGDDDNDDDDEDDDDEIWAGPVPLYTKIVHRAQPLNNSTKTGIANYRHQEVRTQGLRLENMTRLIRLSKNTNRSQKVL